MREAEKFNELNMSRTSGSSSWGNSYRLRSFLELFYRDRSFSVYNSQSQLPGVTISKPGHGYSVHQLGLQYWISRDVNGETWRSKHDMINREKESPAPAPTPSPAPAPAPTPTPPRFNVALWARWLLGSILSLTLPFWKLKWEKLKKIEGETEMVIEEVESVAEVTEKLSSEVARLLPDHTRLKEAALLVEHVSKETAQDAKITLNLIHKVDEVEQDLNELEKLMEPIVDKIVQHESKVTHKNDS